MGLRINMKYIDDKGKIIKVSPARIESLITAIKRTGTIDKTFIIDPDEAYLVFLEISDAQLRYLNMLVFQNKIIELKKFLFNKGFKHKPQNDQ